MRHLLGIEGLQRDELLSLIHNGEGMLEVLERDVKKVPALRGKTVINLFLEPSTRTRTSFEIAAKRLSADAINISESGSSVAKGETLFDTAHTLESMAPDILVIRHKESGAAQFLARYLRRTAIVNAGDGAHEHPTQALLDCVTLKQHFHEKFSDLEIAIVGDIRHSRVARSNIFAHLILGSRIRLVGPTTLVPEELLQLVPNAGDRIRISHRLEEGIEGADVVMPLRMQMERMTGSFVPSLDEYSQHYGISEKRLSRCAPNAVVLHPGPMNRGVEITSEVADGPRSLVRNQVQSGVAVRMAVLLALSKQSSESGEQR